MQNILLQKAKKYYNARIAAVPRRIAAIAAEEECETWYHNDWVECLVENFGEEELED